MTFWIPKYIWAEKTKRSMGGGIWEIKGKSYGSGHEKGYQGHEKVMNFWITCLVYLVDTLFNQK